MVVVAVVVFVFGWQASSATLFESQCGCLCVGSRLWECACIIICIGKDVASRNDARVASRILFAAFARGSQGVESAHSCGHRRSLLPARFGGVLYLRLYTVVDRSVWDVFCAPAAGNVSNVYEAFPR